MNILNVLNMMNMMNIMNPMDVMNIMKTSNILNILNKMKKLMFGGADALILEGGHGSSKRVQQVSLATQTVQRRCLSSADAIWSMLVHL